MSNKIFYTQKNELRFDEPRVLNLSDVCVGKDDWVEYKIVYESIPMTLRFSGEIGDTRFVVVSSSYHLADTSDTREILLYSGLVTSEDALLGILEKCRIDIISERDEKGGYGEVDDEPEEKVEAEMVNHPAHYNDGRIECIDAMIDAFGNNEVMSFCKINAFKYIWRAEHKGGVKDIKKAAWYLNKYIELAGVTEKSQQPDD